MYVGGLMVACFVWGYVSKRFIFQNWLCTCIKFVEQSRAWPVSKKTLKSTDSIKAAMYPDYRNVHILYLKPLNKDTVVLSFSGGLFSGRGLSAHRSLQNFSKSLCL